MSGRHDRRGDEGVATRAAPMRIEGVRTRAVLVPLSRPLATGSGEVSQAPLLLIDLDTSAGVVGRAYLFAIAPWALKPLDHLVRGLVESVIGTTLAPFVLHETLRARVVLPGAHGLSGLALSGIDMAAWDALARYHGLPLATLLGGEPRAIQAYNSNGLGVRTPDSLAEEAKALVADGDFRALKIRLGRPNAQDDVDAVRAVRQAVPRSTRLMADFNQCLTTVEALRRGHLLDGEDLDWIEEPVRADDFRACAQIAAAIDTPVQIGENFASLHQMHDAIRANACDIVMPDVQRIGGVTGWLKAAALADAAGLPMSSHLFPEVSAHLLSVTPTAHWLEFVDWARPILMEHLKCVEGSVRPLNNLGIGLEWDENAVMRFLVN